MRQAMLKIGKFRIDVMRSDHDGGWYAEVWEAGTGRERYSTNVCRTPGEALGAARRWIKGTAFKPKRRSQWHTRNCRRRWNCT